MHVYMYGCCIHIIEKLDGKKNYFHKIKKKEKNYTSIYIYITHTFHLFTIILYNIHIMY
jgi:hypothetical protein